IMPRAHMVPMAGRITYTPMVDVTTAPSAGNSPFFGGMVFNWAGADNIALTQTSPNFRQIQLTSWDLEGYVTLSNQMVEDITLAGQESLIQLFAAAASWQMEFAFLQGLGAGSSMPLGILKAPALISVARGTPNHITAADIAGMCKKMLPYGSR